MIKTFLFSLLLPLCLLARPPLYNEEDHYLYYRCKMLETSIYKIEGLVDIMLYYPEERECTIYEIKFELEKCKLALYGEP